MVSERTVPIKFQAIYQGAVHGMNKVSAKLAQINQQVRQNSAISGGLQRIDQMTSRMAGVGGIGQLNKQVATGAVGMKTYGSEVNSFSRKLNTMSSMAITGTKEVKRLTSQFDRLYTGVNAFKSLTPGFVKEQDAKGKFTGRQYYDYRFGESGAPVTGLGKMYLPSNTAQMKQAMEGAALTNIKGMEYTAKRMPEMSQQALSTMQMLGPSAMETTDMYRFTKAFRDPSNITVDKMTGGPSKGKYSLKYGGENIPGTPWHDDVEGAERFRKSTAKMSKQMDATADKQEKLNRRQGVSFMNLLGLMVKFGVAMELIQAPGKAIQHVQEVLGQAGRLFESVAQISTLVPGINSANYAVIANQFSDIAIKTRAGGEEPAMGVASVGRVVASALETIPHGEARVVDGTLLDAETATLLDMTEQVIKTAGGALETNYEAVAKAMSRYAGSFRVTPTDPRMIKYSDLLSATVDIGDVSAANVAAFSGEIAGTVSAIWGSDNSKIADQALKEMHLLYATGSTTLEPAQIGTGIRNIMNKIRRPSAGTKKYLSDLKDVTAAHPDLDTVDLSYGALRRLKPLGWMREINKQLGTQGLVTSEFIKTSKGQSMIADEAAYFGGDMKLAEENVRAQVSMALLNPMLESIRATKGFQAIMIDNGEKLEKLNLSLNNLTSEIGLSDERFMQAKTTLPASEDAHKAAMQQASRGGLDPQELAQHNLRKTRDIQQIVQEHPGVPSMVLSKLHLVNPSNFIPRAFRRNEEFGRINEMLKEGIKPKDIYAEYEKRSYSIPPELEPGNQGFYNFLKGLDVNEIREGNINAQDGGKFVGDFYSGRFKSPLELEYERTKQAWGNKEVKDYYYDDYYNDNLPSNMSSQGQPNANGNVTNDIDVSITLQSSQISAEEDTQHLVDELSKLFDLESYPDASFTNLNRNIGVS